MARKINAMLNTIIIEDEIPAMEILSKMLSDISPEVRILEKLNSIEDSLKHFSINHDADLIFSDVQLSDGLSFEIFTQKDFNIPVVFITGYDEYIVRGFENNAIDYILKPFSKPDIEKALLKYNNLKTHFLKTKTNPLNKNLLELFKQRKKTRLLVKRGIENISLLLEDIFLINTQEKINYVVDKFSKKYISDKTLTELEEELDRNIFFRANRQNIININFVKSFKTIEKVKIHVEIGTSEMKQIIIISQDTVPLFRKWIQER